MYFRCSDCLAATWIGRGRPFVASETVECGDCGRSHTANPAPELGTTVGSHYEQALEFSGRQKIDIASAYSVLLGLIDLAELRTLQQLETAVDRVVGERGSDETLDPQRPEIDDEVDRLFDNLAVDEPELDTEELHLLDRLEAIGEDHDGEGPSLLEQLGTGSEGFETELQDLLDNIEEEEPALDDEELRLLDRIVEDEVQFDLESETPEVPHRETDKITAEPSDALPEFDPGFRKAVARGRLTLQEAIRRGDRSAYASNLARRFDLPTSLAFAVADNRISLYKARVHQATVRARREPRPSPTRTSPAQRAAVLGLALLAVLGISWDIWSRNFESVERQVAPVAVRTSPAQPPQQQPGAEPSPEAGLASPRPAIRATTSVVQDAAGRFTRITGADARAVLVAFCRSQDGFATLQPLRITRTLPPSRVARLGVFRKLDELSADLAIRIRRDRRSGRWVAGDGTNPIPVAPAPELPQSVSAVQVNE